QNLLQMYTGYLIIVVCSTNSLLVDSYNQLKGAIEGTVCICETPLGISNESTKNPTGTFVVCTTSPCFEGWTFIPRVRQNMRIFVCHHKFDNAALEVAYDLVDPSEIFSFTVYNDDIERF
ncbi:hypothetical protein PMAYCL1PPCAC_03188, partial [Pristionchus mayeri]